MSIPTLNAVWKLKLPSSQKLVLLALANCANEKNICWPSVSTLAADCSCSERTAQRLIADLQKKGLILSTARYRNDGSRTSNHYQILVPFAFSDVTLSEVVGDTATCHEKADPPVTDVVETNVETSFKSPQQHGDSSASILVFPKTLSSVQVQQLDCKLQHLPSNVAQQLLDELSGRMQIEHVRNPIRYFTSLVERVKSGTFSFELGIKIEESRKILFLRESQRKNEENTLISEGKMGISLSGKQIIKDALATLANSESKKKHQN